MELRHLRSFKAVAELLNFSRAAERLHLTQSALSRQVSELEHDLGVRLFDRTHARVRLTDAGRVFYGHSCKILTNVEIAELSARDAASGASGELIVCHDWRLFNEVALRSVADFRAAHPGISVVLREMPQMEQVTTLRERRAHVGFVTVLPGRRVNHGFDVLLLMRSHLLVLVGRNHRLAERREVRLAELAHETWLCTELASWPSVRQLTAIACRAQHFTPKFAPPTKNINVAMARVAAGYGVCLVPEYLAASTAPAGLIRRVRCDAPQLEVYAVWNRTETSVVLGQFLDVLRRNARAQRPARGARRPAQDGLA